MKKTILLLLVAVLSVATIGAQETKKAVYVIDGKHVKNFDGSQLEGKTIISWTITPEHNLHSIITSDMTSGKDVKSVKILTTEKVLQSDEPVTQSDEPVTDIIRADAGEIVYVLDGKIVPYSKIQSISSSKIDSMKVVKDKENHDFKKFADEYIKTSQIAPICVILITTKK